MYKQVVKPILFHMSPEFVHETALTIGEFYGKNKFLKKRISTKFVFEDHRLNQELSV